MSNSSDNDDFTSNLYKMRGRSDSLGKESAGGELYDHSDEPNENEEDQAYQPKRRDTFALRRGTVGSEHDDSYGGGYGDSNNQLATPMGNGNMRDRLDSSNSSDGDGGGYGMRNDRIWSEATSGGGADFRYG